MPQNYMIRSKIKSANVLRYMPQNYQQCKIKQSWLYVLAVLYALHRQDLLNTFCQADSSDLEVEWTSDFMQDIYSGGSRINGQRGLVTQIHSF